MDKLGDARLALDIELSRLAALVGRKQLLLWIGLHLSSFELTGLLSKKLGLLGDGEIVGVVEAIKGAAEAEKLNRSGELCEGTGMPVPRSCARIECFCGLSFTVTREPFCVPPHVAGEEP